MKHIILLEKEFRILQIQCNKKDWVNFACIPRHKLKRIYWRVQSWQFNAKLSWFCKVYSPHVDRCWCQDVNEILPLLELLMYIRKATPPYHQSLDFARFIHSLLSFIVQYTLVFGIYYESQSSLDNLHIKHLEGWNWISDSIFQAIYFMITVSEKFCNLLSAHPICMELYN